MRLSPMYRTAIRKHFYHVFHAGNIYLFGSRVDDLKKGGDIDLYLEVEDKEGLFNKKRKFLARLKREIGDQKIDVVFNLDPKRLIEKEARKWGIKL